MAALRASLSAQALSTAAAPPKPTAQPPCAASAPRELADHHLPQSPDLVECQRGQHHSRHGRNSSTAVEKQRREATWAESM
eukprot:139660-Rhodomonas_salina.2